MSDKLRERNNQAIYSSLIHVIGHRACFSDTDRVAAIINHGNFHNPGTRFHLSVLTCLFLVFSGSALAQPLVYLDQGEFQAALAALGYTAIHEGFESDSAWGTVRSTIVNGSFTAQAITSQGLTWTANNLSSRITTGQGPARTGDWGFYALPHGSYTDPDPLADCLVPGECGDGWRGSTVSGELVAIGGWIETNTSFAKLGIYLGNYPVNSVDLGETCVLPDAEICSPNDVITTFHQFWGVVDTAGFSNFEFRELEGKLEVDGGDIKLIFADDFWFAFKQTDRVFRDGFE